MLSSDRRKTGTSPEAILERDSSQIKDGLIYFNSAGREQTRKRHSIVSVAPTLGPCLVDITGKMTKYRAAISEKTQHEGGPVFFERDTKRYRPSI